MKEKIMIEMIRSLPSSAGIYQYLDAKGRILYIGKAKNLSKRVKSYFNLTPNLSPKKTLSTRIQKMLSETVSMHHIVVNSEHDALILENSLIKQLKPKYNILLRDDKTYPYLYVNLDEPYPRFEITRKILKEKSIRYFGPYSVGARDILDSLYELLPLVQKKSCLKGKKACLFFQMNQCLGPCEFSVDHKLYRSLIDEAIVYIQNKSKLIAQLSARMETLAEDMRFEEALVIRDRIERIQKSQITSQIDLANTASYDVFAIAIQSGRGCAVRLFVREGKITSATHDFFNASEDSIPDEGYERALIGYYGNEKPPIITPILTAHDFEDKEWVESHLSTIFEKKAIIETPSRGNKKQLTDLALQNAYELLRTEVPKNHFDIQALKELCELQRFPERIEIFDNSHFAGTATVGAMVAYENGKFDKNGYRLYHLHEKDEYHQMHEMLSRRIEAFQTNPPPDLWIIDGGETLRSLAFDLLSSSGTSIDVIGISKEKIDAKSHRAKGAARDIIHFGKEPLRLNTTDKRLQFVQMLRDEAHRKAITFHKKTKLKHDQYSKLLSLHGITLPKVHKLLEYFGTFQAIHEAPMDTLIELIGSKDAKIIKNLPTQTPN